MAAIEPSWEVHDDVPAAPGAVVDDGIGSSNEAAAPVGESRPLSSFARLASGEVIGGAVGRTWGECCELRQLWVRPDLRHGGIGSRLVALFEERALARGCTTLYLETFSFQAPAFYRRLGYEVALEIRGYAPGFVKFTMIRRVAPGR